MQVQFASIMETLGNEALGKIMNVVDGSRQQVELDSRSGSGRPQTSVLNILSSKNVGMEDTLGVTYTRLGRDNPGLANWDLLVSISSLANLGEKNVLSHKS